MARIVVGVSGASGVILARKLMTTLSEKGHAIELVMSHHASYTTSLELGKEFATPQKFAPVKCNIHGINDVGSSICSGSYKTDAMVIIPCSMATVAAVASGLADNTLRRAADVTLKEKRKLILVPRETPLSEIHLENMLRLARMGAVILPPIPAWYMQQKTIDEVEDFIVGRVCDALHIEHNLYKEWGS